jgi:ABC-type proline/glycine betaine transport system substrate-binding protein
MKIEFPPSVDFAVRFSLTDYALRQKDIVALCAVASVLTTGSFEINAIGKRAQLWVPNADKVLRSMAKEALLQTVSNTMIESMKNTTTVPRVHITGHFKDVTDVVFTADDWK